ncbi:TonB-dependent receptor [Sphingopyxis sp.]|uniref:TonB-dependent receptor n=1 Tax=Sphingopyxis sp. TaxID=1908224 RepID=UPI0025D4D643|nr:TonB-dependent receptor [Sphingopyxis sp.]
MAAALIAGGTTIAPLACLAEPPAATDQAPSEPVETPQRQYLDADGDPLPTDIQRDLEEQFKETPPLASDPETGGRAGSAVDAPPQENDGSILVTGQRPRGAVVGDIPPERTLNALDIDAYGAGTIGELIQALGSQVAGGRGAADSRPVTLLNGRRVSSFTEIAEIPAEAIERMEVFPEELALRYGYRANQKVVNIVTFERFSSRLGQLGHILPSAGGYDTDNAQANYFAIRGNTRFDFGAEYNRSTSLLESERNLAQFEDVPDAGEFRTLLPEIERLALSGLISGNVLDDVSSTLHGRFEATNINGLVGRDANGPLAQRTDTRTAHIGTTLHGRIGKWLWTFTGNYDRLRTKVFTDIAAERNKTQSSDSHASANILVSGPVLQLPAGPISANVRGSLEQRDFNSVSQNGSVERAEISRDSGAVQVNLDVPITRRRAQRGSGLGNLSVNANLEIEQLSDFGTLRTFGYGLNWAPVEAINFVASVSDEQGAPAMEQLGAPLVVTPNVRIFDFARREVVDVIQTFGGNPTLRSDDRHVLRLGLNAKPLAATDLTLSVDYVTTGVDHPIAPFPIVTPEIEVAFPERFTRGIDGRLAQIDGRPLNFERSRQKQLRWGVNFVRPLGAVEPWMRNAPVRTYSSEAEARAAAPSGTMVAMVQPNSAMARRFENMKSRLFVSLYHMWRLQDEILVRRDLPKLDLLDGAAIDLRGGPRRHELELQAGFFKKGLGARITLNWQSGSIIRNPSGGGDLAFSDLATVNVNLFVNLADRFGGANAPQWLRGARTTLGIVNLFDRRPQVRDSTGSTPLNYQPAYLDPPGRLISFGIRKVF